MRESWLVQRLKKPLDHPHPIANAFAFYGGLRNGGLGDDAMALLQDVIRFDYMGAVEFEFGAVPAALSGMAADARDLTAFRISVPLAEVPRNWRDKSKVTPAGNADIFVLCRKADAKAVSARIGAWARIEYPPLKEGLNLASTLRPASKWDGQSVGWLELDNGFFFATDRDMWAKFCRLFGVDAEAVSA